VTHITLSAAVLWAWEDFKRLSFLPCVYVRHRAHRVFGKKAKLRRSRPRRSPFIQLYIDLFTFCVEKRPYFTGPSRFSGLKENGVARFAAARAAGNERYTGCSTAVGAGRATNAAAALAKPVFGMISCLRDERRQKTGFQAEVGLENGLESARRARLIVGDGRCNRRRDEEGASSQQCRQHNLHTEHDCLLSWPGFGLDRHTGRREFYCVVE
jgi:hypothetical protein